jgi:hypothetical protein
MTASMTAPSRSQLLEELAAEIEAATVQCATQNGKISASVEVDRRNSFVGQRKTEQIAFVIPPGYKKVSFSHKVDIRLSAGGYVKWLNDNPHDGTVVLHAWADAFAYAKASVSGVIATKED